MFLQPHYFTQLTECPRVALVSLTRRDCTALNIRAVVNRLNAYKCVTLGNEIAINPKFHLPLIKQFMPSDEHGFLYKQNALRH